VTDFLIRPYAPRDRAAVRELCFETADAGGSAERYFPDRELFADLWMLYYTDREPEALWVAEQEGRVAGYLAGCLDEARFSRRLPAVSLRVLGRALARGSLLRSYLWRLLAANLPLWFAGAGAPDPRPAGKCAHLHINLRPSLRGLGAGPALMEAFLAAARAGRVQSVRAAVREDNAGARRFFERMGFSSLGRRPAFRTAGPDGREYGAVLYVKTP
jgi:ribosomal protein S18 acetylase RimI-like enzyme